MSAPTKYYSTKQEHMISDYLGWSVVSGSGARAFHPGDIRSDGFLGECKTHTVLTDKIVINNSVWAKIQSEATSVMKRPVLFVDNGTQAAQHTWCVLPYSFLVSIKSVSFISDSVIELLLNISGTRVSFSHCTMQHLFDEHQRRMDTELVALPFDIACSRVSLISLKTLRTIIESW